MKDQPTLFSDSIYYSDLCEFSLFNSLPNNNIRLENSKLTNGFKWTKQCIPISHDEFKSIIANLGGTSDQPSNHLPTSPV